MLTLTPPERRGALVVVILLLVGTAYDRWRAHFAAPLPPLSGTTVMAARGADSLARVPPAPSRAPAARPSAVPLDLNRASAQELDALPGIGPVLAARIVQHRERNGAFRRIEDLAAVRGIGPRAMERLRGSLTVSAP